MKDASNFIMEGLSSLLVGNISYDNIVVPFYALSQTPATDVDTFVNVSSSYVGGDVGSKYGFIKSYTLNLDIVNRNYDATLSERAVNAISSMVTQILIPTKGTSGLQSDSSFHVIKTECPRITPFNDRRLDKWHTRKVLEIEILIQEK